MDAGYLANSGTAVSAGEAVEASPQELITFRFEGREQRFPPEPFTEVVRPSPIYARPKYISIR